MNKRKSRYPKNGLIKSKTCKRMITFICFYLDQAGHRAAHAGGGVEGGPERGVDGGGKVGGSLLCSWWAEYLWNDPKL